MLTILPCSIFFKLDAHASIFKWKLLITSSFVCEPKLLLLCSCICCLYAVIASVLGCAHVQTCLQFI